MRRRRPYDTFESASGGAWGGPDPRTTRTPTYSAGGSDGLGVYRDDLSGEPPAPEGTLGTAVVAGIGLAALLVGAIWGLFGGPDLLGFLGFAFPPLVLALALSVASALDEANRRALARSAGALFALVLIVLLAGVEQLSGVGGLFRFLGVLAGSFALRPLVVRLRSEAYLPPLASGWWIWSVVLAYAIASGSPAGTLRVALVGYLLEWFGPALDRRTAAARERLMRLFRPREQEPEYSEMQLDLGPSGPPGATTPEHFAVVKAIADFVKENFGVRLEWNARVTQVFAGSPKFDSYILEIPPHVSASVILDRSNDLATFLSGQRDIDGRMIRKNGFSEDSVSIKSAAEKGGVRIEIAKSEGSSGKIWFEPFYGKAYEDAIGRNRQPGTPNVSVILGADEEGRPVVAKVADNAAPHLLIAGKSGTGKSYLMHLVLIQLLLQNSPAELRLAIADPKRVGLALPYRRVPHLFAPCAVDEGEIIALMKRVHDEMNERYRLFESTGENTTDIFAYNNPSELVKLEKTQLPSARRRGDIAEVARCEARIAELKARRKPVLLFFIDEVAAISETGSKPLAEAYQRYATLIATQGRAAGVLLVLGVQRPSMRNVGENIRNNLNQRIALQLDKRESEMIIGSELAKRLSMQGDAYLYSNGKNTRFQALLIPQTEADRSGAGANHKLVTDYIDALIRRYGASEFAPGSAAAAAPRTGVQSNQALAAAHGPACDDREWLVIRGMALAVGEIDDPHKTHPLTLAQVVAWARRAAEEYGYTGPAMTEGEAERAIKRFYGDDSEVVKGGVFYATRAIVGPFTARGQTRDLTLVGKFGPAVAETPVGSAGRDPAAVIAEIAARRSRDA